jgi:hypothetical protein
MGGGTMAAMLVLLALSAVKETNSAPENYLEKFRTKHMRVAVPDNDSLVELSYDASVFDHNGQWIEVGISGVDDPKDSDLLALFAPADAYKSGASPVKFEFASAAEGYLTSGKGSLR